MVHTVVEDPQRISGSERLKVPGMPCRLSGYTSAAREIKFEA